MHLCTVYTPLKYPLNTIRLFMWLNRLRQFFISTYIYIHIYRAMSTPSPLKKNCTLLVYMYRYRFIVGSCFRYRWERGRNWRSRRRIVCGIGNIDACKKIFMDFCGRSRVKLVAGGNILPLCVYIYSVYTEIRAWNVYSPPLLS